MSSLSAPNPLKLLLKWRCFHSTKAHSSLQAESTCPGREKPPYPETSGIRSPYWRWVVPGRWGFYLPLLHFFFLSCDLHGKTEKSCTKYKCLGLASVSPGSPKRQMNCYLRSVLLSAGFFEKGVPVQCLGQSVHGYLWCWHQFLERHTRWTRGVSRFKSASKRIKFQDTQCS